MRLPIQVLGPLDEELLARRHVRAHQQVEHLRRLLRVLDPHPAQRPVLRVHGGVRELVGVHLPESLVALDRFLVPLVAFVEALQQAVQLGLGVGVDVLVLLAAAVDDLDPVQGRDRRVDVPLLEERAHVPVEQRQQQGTDVGTIDIGVRHHDDLAVAGLLEVEGAPGPRADHLDDRGALGVAQHVRDRGLLHVEDLAADGQQGLELGVACMLGGAQGAVTLDDEQLGAAEVRGPTVRELGGHGGGLERVLAPGDLLVHASRDPRPHLRDHLVHDQSRLLLLPLLGGGEEGRQLLLDDLGDDLPDRRGTQDLLGLSLELGFLEADGDHGGESREGVVLLDLLVLRVELHAPGLRLDLFAQGLDQGLLEAGHVRAPLGSGDDVDEGTQRGLVLGAPAQGDVHGAAALDLGGDHVPLLVQDRDGLGVVATALQSDHVGDLLVGREVLGELRDPTLVPIGTVLGLLRGAFRSPVRDGDAESRHQERGLAGAPGQFLGGEVGALDEDLGVRPVAHPGAGHAALRLGDHPQLGRAVGRGERCRRSPDGIGAHPVVEHARDPAAEAHGIGPARTIHLDVEAGGQGIDHGGAHAVQTTGGGVGAAAELPAGMQLGVDDLDTVQTGARFLVHRNATTVIADLDGAVVVQHHFDVLAVAAEGLVHRVVEDLPQAVHEPTRIRGADVHARSLADGLESFEDLEVAGVIGRGTGGGGWHVHECTGTLPVAR
jgi:hypothetical protein